MFSSMLYFSKVFFMTIMFELMRRCFVHYEGMLRPHESLLTRSPKYRSGNITNELHARTYNNVSSLKHK